MVKFSRKDFLVMETMNYLVSVYVFRYVIVIVEEEYGSSGAFPVMGFFFFFCFRLWLWNQLYVSSGWLFTNEGFWVIIPWISCWYSFVSHKSGPYIWEWNVGFGLSKLVSLQLFRILHKALRIGLQWEAMGRYSGHMV